MRGSLVIALLVLAAVSLSCGSDDASEGPTSVSDDGAAPASTTATNAGADRAREAVRAPEPGAVVVGDGPGLEEDSHAPPDDDSAETAPPSVHLEIGLTMSVEIDPKTSEWAVKRQWPGRQPTYGRLPVGAIGAFTPVAIVASNERDAWVGATLVTTPYSDDFPGCPSIVHGDADAVYLAHYDGARWMKVAFPGDGPLASMELAPDGTLFVVAGWPRGTVPFRAAKWAAPQSWLRAPNGEWMKMTDFRTMYALHAGYRIVGDRVERLDAFGQWTEIVLPRADEEREDVRFWPVAIRTSGYDNAEIWIDAEQVTNEGGEVRALGMRTWLRAR